MEFSKFLEIFGKFRKCSKIIRKFADMIGTVHKRSQELKGSELILRRPQKDLINVARK